VAVDGGDLFGAASGLEAAAGGLAEPLGRSAFDAGVLGAGDEPGSKAAGGEGVAKGAVVSPRRVSI
jgi:hypothetical protein